MSLFSPNTWPFSLDWLPVDAYLVGGSVRDRLLKRQPTYLDLDFVLAGRAVETASAIAHAYGAGFVVLDEARQIARVVFDRTTVDFAQQQGDSLEADLYRRDFTINAIAYHPQTQTLVDPLEGKSDIASQSVRMVSYQNLEADPLRLLRAYRQAAQLGFTITPETQAAIRQLAPQLKTVSIERVRSELDALLSVPSSLSITSSRNQLNLIEHLTLKSQLLQFCLPHFDAESIEQLAAIDLAMNHLAERLPCYAARLQGWLKPVPAGFHRSWIKAAKLSRLLSAQPIYAEAELMALRYSRSESQVILSLLKAQPDIEAMRDGPLSRSQQFFLFKAVGSGFWAMSLLAIAQGVTLDTLKPMIEKFLNAEDKIAHSQPLITGDVLIKRLGMKPGPEIGKALKAVEMAQAKGYVRNSQEALVWVQQII
ncbi:MAG: CCA tRNA nucleotidyltransferase [Phormidesmis sp.]